MKASESIPYLLMLSLILSAVMAVAVMTAKVCQAGSLIDPALTIRQPVPPNPTGYQYIVGIPREEAQVLLCTRGARLAPIVASFMVKPRLGFAALMADKNCAAQVATVTPTMLAHAIPLKRQDGSSYNVNFVLVQVKGGPMAVLFTTRDVLAAI